MKLGRSMQALRLRLQLAAWRYGWAWPLAGIATLASAGLYLGVVAPNQASLARLREQAVALPARPIQTRSAPAPEALQAIALQSMLLATPALHEQLRLLTDLAARGPVHLTQAEYRSRPLAAAPLLQWQVTQPVQASYPALRRYVDSVLRELPNASLDEISLHRDDIGQGQLQARLRWSLWLPDTRVGANFIAPPATPWTPRDLPQPAMESLSSHRSASPDLFTARSWTPAIVPVASGPAPAPQAPPTPFTYLGKKLEASRWEVYVQHQDRSLVLREGDTVDGAWRIDRILPTTLTLTYLPLDHTRTLAIGDDR